MNIVVREKGKVNENLFFLMLPTCGLYKYFLNGFRVLVQDGCSPVGCVLTQLVKKWGAFVTATCNVRSVPVIKALGMTSFIKFLFELIKKEAQIFIYSCLTFEC